MVGWVYNEHCTFTVSIRGGDRRTDVRTDRLTEHSFLTTDGGVGWVYNEHSTFTVSIIGGDRQTDRRTDGQTNGT